MSARGRVTCIRGVGGFCFKRIGGSLKERKRGEKGEMNGIQVVYWPP